jgi:hypothetical protein
VCAAYADKFMFPDLPSIVTLDDVTSHGAAGGAAGGSGSGLASKDANSSVAHQHLDEDIQTHAQV